MHLTVRPDWRSTGDTGPLCQVQHLSLLAVLSVPVTPPLDCPVCEARARTLFITLPEVPHA